MGCSPSDKVKGRLRGSFATPCWDRNRYWTFVYEFLKTDQLILLANVVINLLPHLFFLCFSSTVPTRLAERQTNMQYWSLSYFVHPDL